MSTWLDRPDQLARSVEQAFRGTEVLQVLELKRSRLYRLRTSRDRDWLVRFHEADRHATVLSALAGLGYPCPRVVETTDGRRVVAAGGERFVVLEWVDGSPPWPGLSALESVGRALGSLHALEIHDRLPEAGMLPRAELGHASASIASIRSEVPRSQVDHFEALERACAGIDFLEDLPRHVLHGDAHPWNAVAAEAGGAVLIDWDSAGLGPPVVDLGFLLLSCLGGSFAGPVEDLDEGRLRAAARGYASARGLTSQERERLAAAVMYRPLVGALGVFCDAVRSRGEVEEGWWWERCGLAARAADLALAVL